MFRIVILNTLFYMSLFISRYRQQPTSLIFSFSAHAQYGLKAATQAHLALISNHILSAFYSNANTDTRLSATARPVRVGRRRPSFISMNPALTSLARVSAFSDMRS